MENYRSAYSRRNYVNTYRDPVLGYLEDLIIVEGEFFLVVQRSQRYLWQS